MNHRAGTATVVTETHFFRFILKSTLVVILGIAVPALILYFSLYQEVGSSYAERYRIISSLKETIFHKAVVIYFTTSLFILAWIVIISLLYSHKIAGPLHKMGMIVRKKAEGDFTNTVMLRKHDLLKPLGDDINDVSSAYRNTLIQVETKIADIRNILAEMEETADQSGREKLIRISESADDLNEIFYKIRL